MTLAELWPLVTRGDVDGVAKTMAMLCPRPAAMGELKCSLFGGAVTGPQLWAATENERVVTVLKAGESAFDLDQLARPERLRSDWSEQRQVMTAGPNAKRLVKLVGKKSGLRRIVEGAVDELVSPLRG